MDEFLEVSLSHASYINEEWIKKVLANMAAKLERLLDNMCPLPYKERIRLNFSLVRDTILVSHVPADFPPDLDDPPTIELPCGPKGNFSTQFIWSRLVGVLMVRRRWLQVFFEAAARVGLVPLPYGHPLIILARLSHKMSFRFVRSWLYMGWPEYEVSDLAQDEYDPDRPNLLAFIPAGDYTNGFSAVMPAALAHVLLHACRDQGLRYSAANIDVGFNDPYYSAIAIPITADPQAVARYLRPALMATSWHGWRDRPVREKKWLLKLTAMAGLAAK